MIFLGLLFGILFTIIIVILIISSQKYEMGKIVFKSITNGFDCYGLKKEEFYLHCVIKDGTETLNYKLKVTVEVFNSYKEGDKFPIKK